MDFEQIQKRIQSLFADIAQTEQKSAGMEQIQAELAALRTRVAELEMHLTQQPIHQRLVERQIYENEQRAYLATPYGIQPLDAPPPDLSAERIVAAPLQTADQTIGALIVETPPESALQPQDAEILQAVAQRAALQIQNLRLLNAAQRARAEAQDATRRYIHERWAEFMDAIQRGERIGYLAQPGGVQPYFEPAPQNADYRTQIPVLEQHIGEVALQTGRTLTEDEQAFVQAVARQVGQQVESLRLLSDAARARAAAEEATRLLTRQSWQEYAQETTETLAFVYDSHQVTALTEAPREPASVSIPLVVRGEPIGQLAAFGDAQIPPESISLLQAIASQTSLHLETLRLNEELQRRAERLRELDRLKSSFLANMSHELRTPLNSILGFTDVILEGIDGPLTEYMDNDLRLIRKNGQHLLHLINDVLDMAKIEAGRMTLHLERFKIHGILSEITSITAPLASEKNLALFITPDSDAEVEIVADVMRFRQVILNLVNNSIKFTEKGKIALQVRRLPDDEVLITVRDTGIGIPATHLESIFQEFSQVDNSTTRKVGGTGLGLPISRHLIEMHGGRLWAESTGISGEGATFFVQLPLQARITPLPEGK